MAGRSTVYRSFSTLIPGGRCGRTGQRRPLGHPPPQSPHNTSPAAGQRYPPLRVAPWLLGREEVLPAHPDTEGASRHTGWAGRANRGREFHSRCVPQFFNFPVASLFGCLRLLLASPPAPHPKNSSIPLDGLSRPYRPSPAPPLPPSLTTIWLLRRQESQPSPATTGFPVPSPPCPPRQPTS